MNFKTVLKIIKEVRNQELADKKQRELDELSAKPLNYLIIEDLIKSAAYGVEINLKFSDGTEMKIEQKKINNYNNRNEEDFI